MKHVMFVRCWRCGTSVMLASLGSIGVGDAGEEESALTTVVRAVVAIATRKSARVVEGICVDCALEPKSARSNPRGGEVTPPGFPPAPDPIVPEQVTLFEEVSSVSKA